MRIYSWNVNGIRAIEKKGFIDWLTKESPDILCIQETKASIDQLSDDLLSIDGYKAYFNSANRKGYSGTAIYYKKEPKKIWTGLPDERFNDEGRTIVMEYDSFLLFNIYFPNGQKDETRLQYKLDFYDCLLIHIKELVKQGKEVIVCGDYNTAHHEIDLKNPKSNENHSGFLPIEREKLDEWVESGFIDTFRSKYPEENKYSWWSYRFNARSKNVGWRIDYHFVSHNLMKKVIDAKIHNEVMGSDHCPVSLELSIEL